MVAEPSSPTLDRATGANQNDEFGTADAADADGHFSARLTSAAGATVDGTSAIVGGGASTGGNENAYYSGPFEEIGVASLYFGHLVFAAAYDDGPGGLREDLTRPHQMCISLGTEAGELYLSWRFLVLELPRYHIPMAMPPTSSSPPSSPPSSPNRRGVGVGALVLPSPKSQAPSSSPLHNYGAGDARGGWGVNSFCTSFFS